MIFGGYAIGASKGFAYIRGEYPLAIQRFGTAIQKGQKTGPGGQEYPRNQFLLRRGNPHRGRRLRLRRGNRPFGLHRGQAGHPPPPPALPGGKRPLGHAHHHQQRRNLRQHSPHRGKGRGMVRRHRHPQEHGHQGFRPLGLHPKHRPGGGAHRHHPAPGHLRHRRGHPRRQKVQGRPDGRSLGRLHPRTASRHPAGLRRPPASSGSIMGSGGPDRHGRGLLHGGRGAVLHGILHGRILRQVRALPGGHQADVRASDQDLHGNRHARRPGASGSLAPMVKETSLCGLGQSAPNPLLSHPAVLPGRVPGPCEGKTLSGGCLQLRQDVAAEVR